MSAQFHRAFGNSMLPLLSILGACGWFEDAHKCEEGAMRCDANVVRVCTVDSSKSQGSGDAPTKWMSQASCDLDPAQGPRVCKQVGALAACVPGGADAGAEALGDAGTSTVRSGDWLRVEVDQHGDGLQIVSTTKAYLEGRPAVARRGVVAAVAYSGKTAVDAALVPDGTNGTAWLRAEGVTRIALVEPTGGLAAEFSLGTPGNKGRGALAVRQSALVSDLPPTLTLVPAMAVTELPVTLRNVDLVAVDPSAKALQLVGSTLNRLTTEAVSVLSEVVFVSRKPPLEVLDAGTSDASTADNGADSAGDAVDGSVLNGPPPSPRSFVLDTRLYVDVSPYRLEAYEVSTEEKLELELELVRAVGMTYGLVAETVSAVTANGSKEAALADFPEWVGKLVQARVSPLLGRRENFSDAWKGLHQVAVDGQLAAAYGAPSPIPSSDAQAVYEGFAARQGRAGALEDFVEYLARAVVLDAWREGPCDRLRDAELEKISTRLLVPLAKLDVLWGLGLLSRDQLAACAGAAAAAPKNPGISVYKANGESVSLSEEPQGVRLVASQGDIHVSGTASRAQQSGVLDIMYRTELPGVVRMQQTAGVLIGDRGDESAATVNFTDLDQADFAPSLGGLIVVQGVSRERIVAHGLMVRLHRPLFGTALLPLVTFRFDQPLWGDVLGPSLESP